MTFATNTTQQKVKVDRYDGGVKPHEASLSRLLHCQTKSNPRYAVGRKCFLSFVGKRMVVITRFRARRRQSITGSPLGIERSFFHKDETAALLLTAWQHIWPCVFWEDSIWSVYLAQLGR